MTIAVPEKDRLNIARNDLKYLSIMLGLLLLTAVALQSTYTSIPDWAQTSPATGDTGDDGDDNTTTEPVEVELASENGQTSEGSSTTVNIDTDQTGIIQLTVVLTWSDDIGSNDELGISISNESGELDSTSGTSGDLELIVKAPSGSSIAGPFEVKISAIECPGLIGPIPVDRDSGNSWSVKVSALVEG